MLLERGIIETPVARPGMSIEQALRICVEHGVPGIPFIDASGAVAGRFSVRHVFLLSSIPPDVIQGAHLIGSEARHIDHACEHYIAAFRRPINPTILNDIASLSSDALTVKAMAMMEQYNSSYLFVIDDGRYLGVVTRLGLTRLLLEEMA